jgi:hypothetical protein
VAPQTTSWGAAHGTSGHEKFGGSSCPKLQPSVTPTGDGKVPGSHSGVQLPPCETTPEPSAQGGSAMSVICGMTHTEGEHAKEDGDRLPAAQLSTSAEGLYPGSQVAVQTPPPTVGEPSKHPRAFAPTGGAAQGVSKQVTFADAVKGCRSLSCTSSFPRRQSKELTAGAKPGAHVPKQLSSGEMSSKDSPQGPDG